MLRLLVWGPHFEEQGFCPCFWFSLELEAEQTSAAYASHFLNQTSHPEYGLDNGSFLFIKSYSLLLSIGLLNGLFPACIFYTGTLPASLPHKDFRERGKKGILIGKTLGTYIQFCFAVLIVENHTEWNFFFSKKKVHLKYLMFGGVRHRQV